MSQPNILFIMTDQQRADALGCSGGYVKTPNLDRLAAEGVRFTNCVTTSPVCIPARLSKATGLYAHNTGVWNNCHHALAPEARTWMQAIRAAGYRTSLFGKTHLHPHHGDLRDREHLMHAYGLDDVNETPGPRACARVRCHMTEEWERLGLWQAYQDDVADRFAHHPTVVRPSPLGAEHYYDTYVGQQAVRYLRDYDRAQPWFCWVSFGGPHEPWDTPAPYAGMYDPAAMPPPRPVFDEAGPRPTGALDARLVPERAVPSADIALMRADYAANITLIDEQIGQIMATIAARGEWANTVVAFSSDHGEFNGDAGLCYKSAFLDGAVRVPLLVRTPATAARGGAVSHSLAEWIDVGPTLAEYAGATLDYRQFARSLAPVVANPAAPHRAAVHSELDGEIMRLDDDWKAVLNAAGEVYLLFNRRTDPTEQHNLAGDPALAGVRDALRLGILQFLMETRTDVR